MSIELDAKDIWNCLKPALMSGASVALRSALNHEPPLMVLGQFGVSASTDFITNVVKHQGSVLTGSRTQESRFFRFNSVLLQTVKAHTAMRMAAVEQQRSPALTAAGKLRGFATAEKISRLAAGGAPSPRRQALMETMIARKAKAIVEDPEARQSFTATHGPEATAKARRQAANVAQARPARPKV